MPARSATDASFILAFLAERLGESPAVYLFGSRAAGEGRADSDFDIAVLADAPLSPEVRHELAGELADRLGHDVDLIDLQTAPTVLRNQVIMHGHPLHDPTPETEAFADFVVSDYARLNEERAAILEDVRRRGRIHG